VKWLTRKFGKSWLLRKYLRHNIKRSVPRSSQLHYIVDNIKRCQDTRLKSIPDVYCPKKVEKRCRTKLSAKDLKFYIFEGILADIFDSIYQVRLMIYMHNRCTKMSTT
jgi:hypothetical protein